MFCFQLACECGYQSENACWGDRPWSGHRSMVLPVFDTATGKLSSYEFPTAEWIEVGDELESWSETYGATVRALDGEGLRC
jgi:hypothetical protein